MTKPTNDPVLEALEQAQNKLLIYRGKLGPEYVCLGGTEYTVLQTRITRAVAVQKAQARLIDQLRKELAFTPLVSGALIALDKLKERK